MDYIQIENEGYFKITDSDSLRPFFMSIVSDSNHWMFISSNGGLSAGRKDRDHALFPYYTDDKLTDSYDTTGSKSIFQVEKPSGEQLIWEPFSSRYTERFKRSRNLYKNELGNKIIFEEVNHDLGLTYRYQWSSSNLFGFVRKSTLSNHSEEDLRLTVLDGLQNVMPYGVPASIQQTSSNLVDAYKRTELLEEAKLALFTLSAIIVDRAEPSEALKANVVWSMGLEDPKILLSSLQLDDFRKGNPVQNESDIKAERGGFFTVSRLRLESKQEKQWALVADVNKSAAMVVDLSEKLQSNQRIWDLVFGDVELGSRNLIKLTQAADSRQITADKPRNTRHYSNVLFNIMRGGIFDDNYHVERKDFTAYIQNANRKVFQSNTAVLGELADTFTLQELHLMAAGSDDSDFIRLCIEYLPLKFSRRHGDPSRPWNRFSINTTTEEGKKILDYEGNWRDIFQNWEALAHSYPDFITGMIHKFLNATTFDGYNPYRVTKGGFDWETIEADDPWSYIGYWGDHQIIYLLKFLEFSENYFPGQLMPYFDQRIFVYANVPYRIKDYGSLLENPKDTIVFDQQLDADIRYERTILGADAALLKDRDGEILKVNMLEKLLATVLAKMSNFIPEGGIWMNTQRPEWNDANNALVGNGVSMVTLNYLRRFLVFLEKVVVGLPDEGSAVSKELWHCFQAMRTTLVENEAVLGDRLSNQARKKIMDGLGNAGSTFRTSIYERGFTTETEILTKDELLGFITLTLRYLEHSIAKSKRKDNLYHAYNLMSLEGDTQVSLAHLSEMLEGQVAVLSSGFISPKDSLALLDGLKGSTLFRPDQYSYLLYPNKALAKFSAKNNIPSKIIEASELIRQLRQDGNSQIVEIDSLGGYHFNGSFNNAESLKKALADLPKERYADLIQKDQELLLSVFETVFDHKSFTGRSGTFFGYEGLGSIYWHMVSKLLLAVQETCLRAIEDKEGEETVGRLLEHYYEINEGIGVHKSPELYGGFPTDPYSHTPAGKGAQQPGMTGQVKEDILTRFGELGVFVEEGQLRFKPYLLRKAEFLKEPAKFSYIDIDGVRQEFRLERNHLGFTYCQVPIVYVLSDHEKGLTVKFKKGRVQECDDFVLDRVLSSKVFGRTGEIDQIVVSFPLKRFSANQLQPRK